MEETEVQGGYQSRFQMLLELYFEDSLLVLLLTPHPLHLKQKEPVIGSVWCL